MVSLVVDVELMSFLQHAHGCETRKDKGSELAKKLIEVPVVMVLGLEPKNPSMEMKHIE